MRCAARAGVSTKLSTTRSCVVWLCTGYPQRGFSWHSYPISLELSFFSNSIHGLGIIKVIIARVRRAWTVALTVRGQFEVEKS